MSHADLKQFQAARTTTIEGQLIDISEVVVTRTFTGDASVMEAAWDQNALIVLDIADTPELYAEGVARTLVNLVQKLRKKVSVLHTQLSLSLSLSLHADTYTVELLR
jgi:hypothetical protein